MLSNYLKIAWRNIVGNPLFSAINIIGLAIGLACCIIITVFVQYESSFDKQWANADRTYRVTRDFFSNNLRLAPVAPPIGPLLAEDFPEIEDFTRAMGAGDVGMRVDQEQFMAESVAIADPNIFEFFAFDVLHGDAAKALELPSNFVLTRSAAERYFGTDNPVGRRATFMGQAELTVAAVIEDLPSNTHMRFDMLLSIRAIPLLMGPDALENWGSNNYYTYLRLPEGYDPEDLSSRFPAFLDKHQGAGRSDSNALNLQRLTDIHLTSNRD
ncbi:MAG: ABC transporter permease, partial [Pseudomonadota bacterium]